ncbi:MAG: hypothetical protein HUJ95_04075 [Bacteroidales bacterium]|nr:hypothetical protein [Bacteroidales bacterium]
MKNYNHKITVLLVALAAFMVSCSKVDDSGADEYKGDVLYATIADGTAYIAETKTVAHPDDGFSNWRFSAGDEISFFADGGYDTYLKQQKEPVATNWKLRRGASSFAPVDPTQILDFNRMARGSCYYPYFEDPDNVPLRTQRVFDGETYTECEDILYVDGITSSQGYLVATFRHRFNMIILIGGNGFSRLADPTWNDPHKDIYVTMNRPMKYGKVVIYQNSTTTSTYFTIPTTQTGATEDDKYFFGHKGPYFEGYPAPDYTPAIYIITPADMNTEVNVEYITAKDDNGVSRTVGFVSKDQYRKSGKTEAGVSYSTYYSKFPTVLEIVENVPTARPAIIPWDDDVEIVGREDQKGIDSPSDFKDWIMAYNSETPQEAELLKFGDKIEIEKEGVVIDSYYRFYLNCDVDLKDVIAVMPEMTSLVNNLNDEFDGQGYALKNVVFTGTTSGNYSIFKEISGTHAKVTNLTIDGLKYNAPDNVSPMGVLATTLRQGVIENVKMKNIDVTTQGAVGALAATITGSATGTTPAVTVKGCDFHGFMIGLNTVGKIVATGTLETPVKDGVSTSNLIFMQNQ